MSVEVPGESSEGGPLDESSGGSFLRAVARAPSVVTATLGAGARVGPFVLERCLGHGGMGEVYLAHDERLGRKVALKVLREEAGPERERRRLLREASAAARVAHPGVVAIFDVGEHEGRPFIAMEYVQGETLRERLARGPLSLDEVLSVARAIARAVAAAHASGVVHRDLKPENVLLDPDGTPRVVDFGLAKELVPEEPATSTTEPGQILGTAGYMSPEQATGLSADARSDVFSLGAMIHELVTGRRPFRGRTRMEVLVATTRDPPAPTEGAPPWLSRVVARCLSKDPSARYRDAGELLEAIEAGETVPYGRGRPARRAVGALLVAAALGGGLAAAWRHASRPTTPQASTRAGVPGRAPETAPELPPPRPVASAPSQAEPAADAGRALTRPTTAPSRRAEGVPATRPATDPTATVAPTPIDPLEDQK